MAAAGAQHLLRRPQRIPPPRGAHDGEMRKIDPPGRQRRGVRQMGRRKPDDALARPGERGKRRQQELQLADAFAPAEDLGQRPGGPAAARKLSVELDKTCGQRGHAGWHRSTAPHRMA